MKEKIKEFFSDIFSIDEDKATNKEIKNMIVSGSKLKGTNMCILVLAIIIASVGLNMNSTAVVIGAMLISPLMGCIIGIGYGIAANDLKFAKKAAIGLLIEVLISITTSTIYFFISPISTACHELLARTTPTIWDVIIAIAGGLAGIIGITRKEKSNVIPGVAIATALMPPLCTAGYGLATFQFKYFLGALYLFFINGFFICLSTILVLKAMKISKKKDVNEKKIHIQLTIISIITVIPSIILAYQIVNESVINSNIQNYLDNEFKYENTQIVKTNIDLTKNQLEVALLGNTLDENEIIKLTTKLEEYELKDINLKITQTEIPEGITEDQISELIKSQISTSDSTLSTQNTKDIEKLQAEVLTLKTKLLDGKQTENYDADAIAKEMKEKYQKIDNCTITSNETLSTDNTTKTTKVVVTITLNEQLTEEENVEVDNYLKQKLNTEAVTINKTVK